jgi:hypothetical protein
MVFTLSYTAVPEKGSDKPAQGAIMNR